LAAGRSLLYERERERERARNNTSQVTRCCCLLHVTIQVTVLPSCSCAFIFLLRIPLLRRDSREHRNRKQSPNGSLLLVLMSSFSSTDKKRSVHQELLQKIQCSIDNIVQDILIGPCLDAPQIPTFYVLSPSHQFWNTCMEQ
jgi:hypothetical protein